MGAFPVVRVREYASIEEGTLPAYASDSAVPWHLSLSEQPDKYGRGPAMPHDRLGVRRPSAVTGPPTRIRWLLLTVVPQIRARDRAWAAT